MRCLIAGVYFGVVLTKSEVISWFRIQEMFRFQSFHMYGVLMTAVAVAAISVRLLRSTGRAGGLRDKEMGKGTRYWLGGIVFGLGWGLAGACPGPILALLGNGYVAALGLFAGALLGTLAYVWLRPKLPH